MLHKEPRRHRKESPRIPFATVILFNSLLFILDYYISIILHIIIIILTKLASTYKVFPSYKPHTMGVDLLCCYLCEREQ